MPTQDPAAFDPNTLVDLPESVCRWLSHAIAPGTPLLRTAVFVQRGRIKVGGWQRFQADWLLALPTGFICAARTRRGPIAIRGYDRYVDGVGEMTWKLWGHVPVLRATGPDVAHNAVGRLAAELCFVPAAALGPRIRWAPLDERRAHGYLDAHGWTHQITVTVDRSGRLERVDVGRWGNPDGRPYHEHQFTAVMDGSEVSAGGFTIPARSRAGWWNCADNCAGDPFINLTIEHAEYS